MTDEDPLAGMLPEPSLCFRGGLRTLPREALETGKRYHHSGAIIGTRDVRLATDNFTDSDVIALLGSSGMDTAGVSADPAALEIVYPPDLTFTVVAQQPLEDGLWLTVLVVEDKSRAQELDVRDAMFRIGTAVMRARTLPPVEARGSHRYAGPIGIDDAGHLDRLD